MPGSAVTCEIVESQSTFWRLSTADGEVRVDFRGKAEFHVAYPYCAAWAIVDTHPLLLNHNDDWQAVYIASSAGEPDALVDRLVSAWAPVLQSWRSAFDYLSGTDPARMLEEGHGQLLAAPAQLVSIAAPILSTAGVRATVHPERRRRAPLKALIAGDSFVVAADFTLAPAIR